MRELKTLTSVFLVLFLIFDILASNGDSLFVQNVKQFIYSETNFNVDNSFFTLRSKSEKPYIALYISSSAAVRSPYKSKYIVYGINEELAESTALKHQLLGHHTFLYKTYATAAAELNDRFTSYTKEAKCFIMLHEFFHHYKEKLNLAIPYEFEEAIGDVIGNYGTIEFIRLYFARDVEPAIVQKNQIEGIYRIINKTSDLINATSENVRASNRKCQKRIQKALKSGDLFQSDRFNYVVNNAYLLKNRYYSEKYFLLKKVFIHGGGTVEDFIKILKNAPKNSSDFEMYLKGILTENSSQS
ncbi:MAG TPA: hypothetical protein VEW65_12805 [Chryseolinea sp.]|nr:hypothetical protein [Chryseolinea sp.]